MRFFSAGGEPAVIGVGQEAIGIVAVGQFARGFVAIGQIAIGVVTIGQGSLGVVGVGQGGFGLLWFAGMLGVGGRGICLRLIPAIDPARFAPEEVPLAELVAHRAKEGFVRASVASSAGGTYLALPTGEPLPAKPTPAVLWALVNAPPALKRVYARVRRVGPTLVCDRLVEEPGQRPSFGVGLTIVRFLGLVGLAAAWWYLMLGLKGR